MKPARAQRPSRPVRAPEPWWLGLWTAIAWACAAAVSLPASDGGRRTGIPKLVASAVMARDQRRCRKCGSIAGLELHHRLYVVDGGRHSVENLIVLCGDCHVETTLFPTHGATFDLWLALPKYRVLMAAIVCSQDEVTSRFRDELLRAAAACRVPP